VFDPDNVVSHWHDLIDDFETSSMGFYDSVVKALEARAIPQTFVSRVAHKEAGLASADREYLHMNRGKYAFDLCAAPFGKSFFLSWWLTVPALRFGWLYTFAFFFFILPIAFSLAYAVGVAIGAAIFGLTVGAFFGFLFSAGGVLLALFMLGLGLRNGTIAGESTVIAIPIVGWLYERAFAPDTFYTLDSALMFQESVHRAVLEVGDCLTKGKGMRALPETARKPVMKHFGASA